MAPSGFQAPTFHHATFPPPQQWSSNSSTGQWESAQHWSASASASQGQGGGADSPVSGGSSTSGAQLLNPTSGGGGGGGSGLSFQHGGIGSGRVGGVVGGGFSINQHGGMEPSLQQQHSFQELVGGSASGPNGGGGGVVGTSLARYASAAGLVITPKPDGAQHNVNNNNNNNLSDPLQVSTSVCLHFVKGFCCEGGFFSLLDHIIHEVLKFIARGDLVHVSVMEGFSCA